MIYITKDNDMLDEVCYKYYQNSNVITDVLEANHFLADKGPILQAGIEINLPELPEELYDVKTVKLWD